MGVYKGEDNWLGRLFYSAVKIVYKVYYVDFI